jgi:dihydroorotate dehydrogenase (fumarate)
MINLSTKYMGLLLKNPIIVGSSGLTNSVEKIKEIEKSGAGAVVLKSLFEEQIQLQINKTIAQSDSHYLYPEAADYIGAYTQDKNVGDYLNLIRECKSVVNIPVIASINCVSSLEWLSFASKMQQAGADALELNIFVLPSDPKHTGEQNEQVYFDVALGVIKEVAIPVSLKISHYFSGFAKTALNLSWTGIKGMVLFNRFFSPDIDIENFEVTAGNDFSTPHEISNTLRWVAMLSDKLHCDLAASTGVHDGEGAVKMLLAGAKAVQVASTIYKNGPVVIPGMINFISDWMKRHEFQSTTDFIGKMSYKATENPAAYERVQFMKHFAGIE